MPDQAITWPALVAVIGTAGTVLTGLWAIYGAIKKQFDAASEAGEARAVRTHQRIDDLHRDMRENFTPRDVHAVEIRRLDEALHERDRQLSELAGRLHCPGPRGFNQG